MKTTIKFETDNKNIELFEGCNTIEDSIHEALCLAIHEGNEDALAWLQDNVINIA